MKPIDTPILEFISSSKRTFTIPVYQRNYSWKTEQCVKLFEDVLQAKETNKDHYFGNVVYYAIETDNARAYTEFALIDGQQRITTIMLLIAAARDCEKDESVRQDLSENFLINPRFSDDAERGKRVKLKQIESDRGIYEAIVEGTFDGKGDSNAARNYKTFKQLINKYKITTDEILDALGHFIIIALDLKINENKEKSESPQIIFESINATGKHLTTADLLRNYLLTGIPDKEQEKYYKEYWLEIELRLGDENISDFVNKYLILKTGDQVNKDTEYSEFKKYQLKNKISAEEALKDLTYYSKYYSWVIQPDNAIDYNPETRAALWDLKELNTTSMTPLILFVVEKALNPSIPKYNSEELNKTLRILESWVFRARIKGDLTSGAFNTISSTSILNRIRNISEENYHEQIEFELSNYRTQDIWPADNDFKEAFKKYNFYKTYKNYVQRKLENQISKDHHNWKPDSIEHIMPETLNEEWKKYLGPDWATIHAEYLHTIGNLTPLNQSDNSINSNDQYQIKIKQYANSSWKLTRDICTDYPSDWNEKEINSRAEALAKVAVQIWKPGLSRTRPIEAEIKKKDNERIIRAEGYACSTTFHINYVKNSGYNVDAIMTVDIIDNTPIYTVKAGSKISPRSISDGEKYLKSKVSGTWNGESTLVEDIVFKAPSPAASFVEDNGVDGWVHWKTEEKESLDEVVAHDNEIAAIDPSSEADSLI